MEVKGQCTITCTFEYSDKNSSYPFESVEIDNLGMAIDGAELRNGLVSVNPRLIEAIIRGQIKHAFKEKERRSLRLIK